MPRMDLSKKRSVDARKPPKAGSVDYFDTSFPGFALRVTANGVKTFYCFYRVQDGPDKGRLRRHRLEPRYPALTCKAARESAGDVFARLQARTLDNFKAKTIVMRHGGCCWCSDGPTATGSETSCAPH